MRMNLIEKELELAKETEMFVLIPGTELVELSRRNVAKVEAIIQNDSSYIKSSDKKAGPDGKNYGGSTAYWMVQFSQVLSLAESSAGGYVHVLREVVNAVDRDNSTHLNADGVGREEMWDRLLKIPKQTLVQYLKFPKESNYRIIQELSLATHPKSTKYKPRENLSFASKFCHYACFYLFEGENEQDNFSICDTVVKKVLPRYCEHFHVPKLIPSNTDYSKYQQTIDEIINVSGSQISRNGFDHLLWYYFKGRI